MDTINEYLDYLDFMEPINEVLYESEFEHWSTAGIKAKIYMLNGELGDVIGKIGAANRRGDHRLAKELHKKQDVIYKELMKYKNRLETGKDIAKDTAEKLTSTGNATKYILAGAVAAAAVVAAYKIYKRFFSKAAKACKGKSGGEKTACMKKYKIDGLKAAKAEIMKSMSKCAKSKNPEKCKVEVKKKALKFDAKIAKIK